MRHRIVAVTPAGRRHYLELLHHYIAADSSIDEWHLWDNCRNPADRTYIEELARRDARIRLIRLAHTDGSNRSINRFYPLASDPGTFYIKMDDDLVYLAPELGESLYQRACAERSRAIWWSPLVINNALCSALLKYHTRLQITAPLTAQASCPIGWRSPQFAQQLHQSFLLALAQQRLGEFSVPSVDLAATRFSINCIGFFGEDVQTLGERFCPAHVDDEEWISAVLPVTAGRPGRLIGDLLVAHFSFFPQEAALLMGTTLAKYYAHRGLEPPSFQVPKVPLKQRVQRALVLRSLGGRDVGTITLPHA